MTTDDLRTYEDRGDDEACCSGLCVADECLCDPRFCDREDS